VEYRGSLVAETVSISRWWSPFKYRRSLLQRSRSVSRFTRIRRKCFKLLGITVLVLVGLFDYFAWRHLVYGELSVGLWVGFGMLALLSIPVTFFGLIAAAVLLMS
jgi:hypothetical protein